MCEPISQPASISSFASSQDIGISSAAFGPSSQRSIPGHDIGSSVPMKSVGTKTVAFMPWASSTGFAAPTTER